MKIAISNPSKQYTHQTVAALAGNSLYEVYFLTSFWFMPETIWWHRLLSKIPPLHNQVKKKSGGSVPNDLVVMHWSGVWYSFFGRFFFTGEKRSFIEDKIHDRWVKKWIAKHQPDLLIGYEKSCLDSFKAVKQYKGKCLLDLAQVHILFIENLRKQYPFFEQITGNEKMYTAIKKRKLEEYILADKITVLSSFAKQTMVENGISDTKIDVVTLGANTQLFKPKNQYNVDGQKLKLLFVGTVTKRKGIHILCNVVNSLKNENIELAIIGPLGDGIQLNELLKNNPSISYTSFLHHEQLAIKMKESDIFVFPSYLDSWAMVVVEAMACGLPVIVTENTGAKSAVDKECGFILPVDNEDELREKILFFNSNRTELMKMGGCAKEKAKNFDWDQYCQAINKVVESALKM